MKIAIKFFLSLFLVIMLFFFFSCNTRKKTVTKESIKTIHDTLIKRDSIFIEREKVIYLPSSNSSVIPNPCNEKGKLNPINENIKTPFGNVHVSSDEKGNLKIKATTDSIQSVYEKQYHDQNKKQLQRITELERESRNKEYIPFYGWVLFISSVFLNIILIKRYFFNTI
ncbi:hypothetical protein ETU08_08215 [Apibacter muscae]|uniref:hypothetical protein n=1 Tax=Apibacter muscae TaxID=2509004 RepID=UPI0011AD82FF|nr:hypothetical protein [Apibacter muscae]TWP28819.1 hypothetical protein ETU08_08215 [Apibacter muscae]